MHEIGGYLSGKCFSDDFAYQPQIIGHHQPRGDLLTARVAGRRVLHVGFADHVPLIARRVADGSWLHARLTRSASVCEGIDIDAGAVTTARGLGFNNVHVLDVFSSDAAAQLARWEMDLVLVPDVIEHLPDPAAFLRRLASCLPRAEFVVTVPNALSLRNAVHAVQGVERVNTDHRSWFSPFTLLKVLADAGLQCDGLHGCPVSAASTFKGKALRAAVKMRPIWSDVLLAEAKAVL
ncbi:class I SAM-dependent methyltransferase [Ramlibacter tataouinensis]|uniref:DHHB methyltransferase n=1 Tax=Ramlibacter tataouinensis (strain ATCC BAA-407 / DSM 14655 / LMG 21543 / TTB310) TaxID=365046 RepID=F5Y5P9_RAMTT|nr:methyltransferase domain-containing protein [Ramlibacter tataouinensis]AEG93933.1 DHHB methyltransferase [Ramlibacter tataouinensis TTB310]